MSVLKLIYSSKHTNRNGRMLSWSLESPIKTSNRYPRLDHDSITFFLALKDYSPCIVNNILTMLLFGETKEGNDNEGEESQIKEWAWPWRRKEAG